MMKFFSRLLIGTILLTLGFAVLTKSLPLPGTIPILMYHSLGSRSDAQERKNFVSVESFSKQMKFLKFFGFRILSMDAYQRIRNGEQKAKGREIVITFDDGNATFFQEAWPILKEHSFPVTLFLVSESVKREMNGSMTLEDFEEILHSGLVTIGSNTKTHPALPEINDPEHLREEIEGSKKDLEEIFKVKVNYFSYPNGDLEDETLKAVRDSGYHLAFTTSYHKLGRLQETPFSITRLNITRTSDNPIIFWAKITGIYQTHKYFWQKLKSGVR